MKEVKEKLSNVGQGEVQQSSGFGEEGPIEAGGIPVFGLWRYL